MATTAPGKTFGQKVWVFLNTPFGLWFLTTIAVGMLTWSYSQWQASQICEKENEQQLRQLYLEVAGRVEALDTLATAASDKRKFYEALPVLDDPKAFYGVSFGIFPEYQGRSMRSLLFELQGLVEKNEEAGILEAIAAANQINAKFRAEVMRFPKVSDPEAADEPVPKQEVHELKYLLRKMSLSRR